MPGETEDSKPSISKLQKILLGFIEETRKNFSDSLEEGNHDFKILQAINENINILSGKVDSLAQSIEKLNTTLHKDNKNTVETMETKVDEIKEEVASKKVIVKEVPHFSFIFWLKTILKNIKK